MENSRPRAASGRKIIHLDMDAFYASVEQHDRPELKGKPVVVGGDPRGRGVVAAASYEARKFGVRSAMSSAKAIRLCPQLIFVRPRFERYHEVSERVHRVFEEATDLIEPLSLDEAYLDVTENKLGLSLARDVAKHLKQRIRDETGLTASAGVGPNKFVAKIASDLRKPDGLVVIPPERVKEFLERLPVEKLWGVGPATSEKLHRLGFRTIGELGRASAEELESQLGSFGAFLAKLAQGEDSRPVETEREPRTRGSETTFDSDILDTDQLVGVVRDQADELGQSLAKMGYLARTITLKLRYSDFTTITRSRTLYRPTSRGDWIAATASELLLTATEAGSRPVRLIGVGVSGLIGPEEPQQLWLEFTPDLWEK